MAVSTTTVCFQPWFAPLFRLVHRHTYEPSSTYVPPPSTELVSPYRLPPALIPHADFWWFWILLLVSLTAIILYGIRNRFLYYVLRTLDMSVNLFLPGYRPFQTVFYGLLTYRLLQRQIDEKGWQQWPIVATLALILIFVLSSLFPVLFSGLVLIPVHLYNDSLSGGQWTRLFAAHTLHHDAPHLFMNIIALLSLNRLFSVPLRTVLTLSFLTAIAVAVVTWVGFDARVTLTNRLERQSSECYGESYEACSGAVTYLTHLFGAHDTLIAGSSAILYALFAYLDPSFSFLLVNLLLLPLLPREYGHFTGIVIGFVYKRLSTMVR